MPAHPDLLWTEDEDDRLRLLYETAPVKELRPQFPGRSNKAIYQRATLLGLRSKTLWTEGDDAVLKAQYGLIGAAACAAMLGRSLGATYARAQVLGLKAPSPITWTPEEDAILRAHVSDGLAACKARLNRAASSICDRVRQLGLEWPKVEVPVVGTVYGKIKVIEYKGARSKRTGIGVNHFWLVECDCGERFEVRQDALIGSRRIKSCGHDKGDNAKKKNDARGVIRGLSAMYKSYKNGAARRNLPFELTMDEFYILISSNCYYCGIPPQVTSSWNGLPHNGIDRSEGALGYINGNCLPSCPTDNFNKGSRSRAEYEAHLERVTAFRMSMT